MGRIHLVEGLAPKDLSVSKYCRFMNFEDIYMYEKIDALKLTEIFKSNKYF